jgi:hypothetical protein
MGGVMVTVAEADLVLSAWLVAVTVQVPGAVGAEYSPVAVIAPQDADQLTAVLAAPLTVTANCSVPPACTVAELGETVTVTCCVFTPQPMIEAAQNKNTEATKTLIVMVILHSGPIRKVSVVR